MSGGTVQITLNIHAVYQNYSRKRLTERTLQTVTRNLLAINPEWLVPIVGRDTDAAIFS